MTDDHSDRGRSGLGRRAYLRAVAAAGVAGVAGCSAGGQTGGGGATTTDTAGSGNGTTTTADHAALTDIADQPVRGDPVSETSATIVAFEDPSCIRCAAFEKNVVPKIQSNLLDTGKASLVFRGYPVVYEWGEPATHLLEATFAASADAHWTLLEAYFSDQSAFRDSGSPGGVYERTRKILESDTDVDAEAVVSAAGEDAAKSAVQADLDAGEKAGAGGTTPSLFMFRDGEYLTKAQGSVGYPVIESTLGV